MPALKLLSPSAARTALAILQEVADEQAAAMPTLDDYLFVRIVLEIFKGRLELSLPRVEWDRVDIRRKKKKP